MCDGVVYDGSFIWGIDSRLLSTIDQLFYVDHVPNYFCARY